MKRVILAILCFALLSCILQNANEKKKQAFLSLLGELPNRENVKVKITDVREFDKYLRKTLRYSIVGDTIEAYLLLPKNISGIVPGILAIHQDGAHRPYEFGKGEPAGVHGDPELQYGLELCLRGYIVICPDRFPFESRMLNKSRFRDSFNSFPVRAQYEDDGEVKSVDLTEDLYRGAKASYYLVDGKTALGVELSELMFAIDYLCTLKEVDETKLGVIGHSAGGFLSSILMYVDERIKVGCSSCGTFLIDAIYNSQFLRPINGFCGLLTIPNLKQWGDMDDILAGLYPRPFIETSADINRQEVHQKAIRRYTKGGKQDRITHVFYDAKAHIFRKDMREKSYDWFDKRLKSD